MIADFGVRRPTLGRRDEQLNQDGSRSIRLRVQCASSIDDLIGLWGRVGFEYNAKRSRAAAHAVAYLREKRHALTVRDADRPEALTLRNAHGWGPGRIARALDHGRLNERFIQRTIYENSNRKVRTPSGFPTFGEWRPEATRGLGDSGAAWATVVEIEAHPDPERVYDLHVAHPDHNFVANGLCVHNCGVRFLTSNLDGDTAIRRLRPLAESLAAAIPAGVGSRRGDLAVSEEDLDALLYELVGDASIRPHPDMKRGEKSHWIASIQGGMGAALLTNPERAKVPLLRAIQESGSVRPRERESLCVYVCVIVRLRDRHRERERVCVCARKRRDRV